MTWRIVGASAVGTSHLAIEAPCQDRLGYRTATSPDGTSFLAVVVSDGAGSASRSDVGAQIICTSLLDQMTTAVAQSSNLDDLEEEHVRSWVLAAQSALRAQAAEDGMDLREYAGTAVLGLFGDVQGLCAQVGDGALVVRNDQDAAFDVALWPDGGEYLNHTYFVSDPNVAERVHVRRFDRVSDVVVFSDGLQKIALHAATRTAHAPFFKPLVDHVRSSTESDAQLNAELEVYLKSSRVTDKTDDDTSIVIACRV